MRPLLILAALCCAAQSYNVAIFAPDLTNSQILWNKRVGEELARAGHNVTIFMLHYYEKTSPKIDINPKIHLVHVNSSTGVDGEKMLELQSYTEFHNVPVWDKKAREFMEIMTVNRETEVFRKIHGEDFPDLSDLASKAPLVMINSNELYDFPRPNLHKIIPIGGLGIKQKNAKNLTGEFATRTEKAKDGVIVFSFGSIAPVYLMPEEWKQAYFGAFAEFPNVQFFMRHERAYLHSTDYQ